MMDIQIRGYRKPNKSMKLIIDEGMTPIEKARFRYYQLFERQMLINAEKREKSSYLYELKQLIKSI